MTNPTIQQIQKDVPARHATKQEVKKLHELYELARQARGRYYPKHVEEGSRKFSELIYKMLCSGVRYSELEDITGLQWRSLKSRLARHQYFALPPSQQDKVFQGPKTSGPQCDHDTSRWRERRNKKTGKLEYIECLDCRTIRRQMRNAQQTTQQTPATHHQIAA